MASIAERFMALFAGLERAFGQYIISPGAKADERGKRKGQAETWSKRPLELLDWEDHLAGKRGLGICPLTDDSTCRFAAIDVDLYPLDPMEIHEACRLHSLPLILCRSKSGGVHCYVFFSEPIPASFVRERIQLWATLIGHAGVEVFPSHDTMGERTADNWINIPYCGEYSLRYAYGDDGKAITIEEFLDLAASRMVDRRWLEAWEPQERPEEDPDSDWYEAPPCLVHLASHGGFAAGARNNAMFNVGRYHKERYGNGYKQTIPVINQKYFKPPLRDDELRTAIASVGRRNYSYMCDKAPINQCCDRQTCVTKKYGVKAVVGSRSSNDGLTLGKLQKVLTEPPIWILEVNGTDVELTTHELVNQRLLWEKVVLVTSCLIDAMKPAAFNDMIRKQLANVEVVHVSDQITFRSQVWHYLVEFCETYKKQNASMDDLHGGKPYKSLEDGRVYFLPSAFSEYLSTRRFAYVKAQLQLVIHTELGVTDHRGKIRGRETDYWSVEDPTSRTEPFKVPRVEKEEPF